MSQECFIQVLDLSKGQVLKLLLFLFCSVNLLQIAKATEEDFVPRSGRQESFRNLHGKPGEGYYLEVLIGTPPQKLNVLIDTGSTNFAIAAAPNPNVNSFFIISNSSTYVPHDKTVSVPYTQGYWKGKLGADVVLFPSLGTPRVRCDIAVIETSHNFYMNGSKWQGILGLAYPSISRPDSSVVSWLEALSSKNSAMGSVFGLQLCGSESGNNSHSGIFEVGHISSDLLVSNMLTTPIVKEWFYEVLLTGISVGEKKVDLPCKEYNTDKTIVDSGTTNLRLPKKVFKAVVDLLLLELSTREEVSGISEDFWTIQKMLCLENEFPFEKFPNITLTLAESDHSVFSLEIVPQSYIRRVYDNIDDPPLLLCYKFAIDSSDTGSVLGVAVMEGFYVLFNRTSKTVGFSETNCGPSVRLHGPFYSTTDTKSCAHPPVAPAESALTIAAYVVAALMSMCGLLLVYFLVQWLWEMFVKKSSKRSVSEVSLINEDQNE